MMAVFVFHSADFFLRVTYHTQQSWLSEAMEVNGSRSSRVVYSNSRLGRGKLHYFREPLFFSTSSWVHPGAGQSPFLEA